MKTEATRQKKNAFELIVKINEVKSQLTKLECELAALPGSSLIREVFNRNILGIDSDADLLVASLRDRDWAMTVNDIKVVFDASGFIYEKRHIDACEPESDETVREYILQHQND